MLGQEVLDYGYLLVYSKLAGWGLHEHGGICFPAASPRPLLGRHPELLIESLWYVADLHRSRQIGRRQLPAARGGEEQYPAEDEEKGERDQSLTHPFSHRLRPLVLRLPPVHPRRRRSSRPGARGSPGWAQLLPRRCPGGELQPCQPPA